MGTLRTKMEQDLAIRGISARTGQNYLRFVDHLTGHYGRAPETLTLLEIEASVLHLRQFRELTPETVATMVTGLRFFYHVTLGRAPVDFRIPAPSARAQGARAAEPPGGRPAARPHGPSPRSDAAHDDVRGGAGG